MENNNNNGRGIFYGVIGVATLVVTIIGATFAYFSASINSTNNAIRTQATNVSLGLTQNVTGIKTNIVPVDETTAQFAKGGYIGDAVSSPGEGQPNTPKALNCVDDDGNEFCSVYQFTITNTSTVAQTVYATMTVTKNEFTTNALKPGEDDCTSYLTKTGESMYCQKSNLAFAIFKGSSNDVEGTVTNGDGWNVTDAAVTQTYTADTAITNQTTAGNTVGTTVTGALGDMVVARTAVPTYTGESGQTQPVYRGTTGELLAPLSQTLKPGGAVTYTVLVWLHENWQNQEADEGKQFLAGITFDTASGGKGVTAILGTAR